MQAQSEVMLVILSAAGRRTPARMLQIEKGRARLELDTAQENPGALVEFEWAGVLYLGEIAATESTPEGLVISVSLEHCLNLEKAAAIQRNWGAV